MRILRKRFYRLVRRLFPYGASEGNERIRSRLSIIYMLSAWQLTGALIYLAYSSAKRKQVQGVDQAEFYASSSREAQSATIISLSGTQVSKRYLSKEDIEAISQKKAQAQKS